MALEQNTGESNVMNILQGKNSHDIKDLIDNSDDDEIKKNLRFLNMDGSVREDEVNRRGTNKAFFNCLLEKQENYPSTLVWLKRKIDSDICDTMLSDWEHSGNFQF